MAVVKASVIVGSRERDRRGGRRVVERGREGVRGAELEVESVAKTGGGIVIERDVVLVGGASGIGVCPQYVDVCLGVADFEVHEVV